MAKIKIPKLPKVSPLKPAIPMKKIAASKAPKAKAKKETKLKFPGKDPKGIVDILSKMKSKVNPLAASFRSASGKKR